ncbi:hypothetical protein RJT34_00835 [Clitoria ternatea]|uniref:J domain-containing protein n=1 Tax=Clitoria ternatea TaxID=43366 RepID=A0AAN9KG82_CLITE
MLEKSKKLQKKQQRGQLSQESQKERETTSAWVRPYLKLFPLNDAVAADSFNSGLTHTISNMQISRWRNLLSFNTHAIPSSAFHSSPCSCQKWKTHFNSDIRGGQQPSKTLNEIVKPPAFLNWRKSFAALQRFNWSLFPATYDEWFACVRLDCTTMNQIKYITRQKRADAKKALNSLLYNSGSSKFSFEEKSEEKVSVRILMAKRSMYSRQHLVTDGIPGPLGIGRVLLLNIPHLGSGSDRTILGLPPTGPLKIEDVKNAFRLSALKWHPDKHQGPSQAIAEEKFKLCVNAYKTLCNALSPS